VYGSHRMTPIRCMRVYLVYKHARVIMCTSSSVALVCKMVPFRIHGARHAFLRMLNVELLHHCCQSPQSLDFTTSVIINIIISIITPRASGR